MIERILAHEKHRCRFGQPVRAEIGAGVYRLLGHVEKQNAPGALQFHDSDRLLRNGLMREEIQFEAPAKHFVGNVADPSLQCDSYIRYENVETSESAADRVKGPLYRIAVGNVARYGEHPSAKLCRGTFKRLRVQIDDYQLRPPLSERFGRSEPYAACSSGNESHLAGKHIVTDFLHFRLLHLPVLDIENIPLGNRLESSDRLRIENRRGRAFGDIGINRSRMGSPSETEQSEPRDKNNSRERIEHRHLHARSLLLTLKISEIFRFIPFHGLMNRTLETLRIKSVRSRNDERPVFCPDNEIRRHGASAAYFLKLDTVHVLQYIRG